jgi:type IV secretory pathway VirB10-like protein
MPSIPRTPDSRYPAHGDTAGRHDEPTPSQLDRIAEVNARARREARRGRGRWLAAVTGAAILLALALGWQHDRIDARKPATAQDRIAAPPVAAVQPSAASAAVLAPAVPDVAAAEPAPQAVAASAAVAPPQPAVDRARQLRAKQDAQARAKAVEQEQALARSLADEQDRQRREADRAREQADEASRRAAQAAPTRTSPAPEPRRTVRELCSASSNIFSENACFSRECRKPDNQGDPICVRLREIEEAQRFGGRQ